MRPFCYDFFFPMKIELILSDFFMFPHVKELRWVIKNTNNNKESRFKFKKTGGKNIDINVSC